mgnify:CR=1 FL=1
MLSKKFFALLAVALVLVYSFFYFYLIQTDVPSNPAPTLKNCKKQPTYDTQQCMDWVNAYPYSGGVHNCCGKFWNEQIRFKKDFVMQGGTIVELGGNTGNDIVGGLIDIYKPSFYHVVEPIPAFVETIKERVKDFPHVELHAHVFGIGMSSLLQVTL